MSFIGVIDSGVGGLTILQKLLLSRPHTNFCYIADHAFCPYGNKSNDVIFSRASKLIKYLKYCGAQAVVIACNTISVYASELQLLYDLPVYDVITPTCNAIIANTRIKRVALLATKSTINNGVYHSILIKNGIEVVGVDCSNFVQYVEQHSITSLKCLETVDKTLHNLPNINADCVILGCTHFPLLRRQIARYCRESTIVECECRIPDGLASTASQQSVVEYLTTGDVQSANNAAIWFKKINFQHIDI